MHSALPSSVLLLLVLLAGCNGSTNIRDGGPIVLDTAPSVSLVATTTRVTAAASVTLVAAAVDDSSVARVEFYEGSTKLSEATMSPYVSLLSFTAADNGTHTYSAKAFDSGNQVGLSNSVTVSVDIGGDAGGSGGGTGGGTGGGGSTDVLPPTLFLVSSVSTVGAAMPLALTVTASDDRGVAKVELYDGFIKVGELNKATAGSNWVFTFNVTLADNGSHHYSALAWDAALNHAQSNVATVNVAIFRPSAIKQVVGGGGYSYLVKHDGSVFVTGGSSLGATGGATYRTFARFPGLTVKATGFGPYSESALFIMPDGTLAGIGSNTYGYLGIPGGGSYAIPTQVSPPVSDVAQVYAANYGNATSCIIKTDTTVWCMGAMYVGNNLNATGSEVPSQVLFSDGGVFTGARQVGGFGFQTVLRDDGTVWAWGSNNGFSAGVGDGTTAPRFGAVPVIYLDGTRQVPLSGVSQIAATQGAAFALVADGGTVVGWGTNQYGILGDNSAATFRLVATPVYALGGITFIAAGLLHMLAVDAQGNVWAWGFNSEYELGNPALGTSNSNVPVQVPGLTGVVAVAGGYDFSFALKGNGELWGWGGNGVALGIDDAGTSVQTPHRILVPDVP